LAENSFQKLFVAFDDQLSVFEHDCGKWSLSSKLRGTEPRCVLLDPLKKGRVYCGTFARGLWASDDNGNSWNQIAKETIEGGITSMAISPKESGTGGYGAVYVGTEPSVLYSSDDGGKSWKISKEMLELSSSKSWSFPPKPYTHHVRTIVLDPNHLGLIYLAIEAGALIRSFDGGKTWKDRVVRGPYDTHNLVASPTSPGRIYSAAGDGYFESLDYGDTWQTPDKGLEHTYLYSVAVHPKDPDTILISASDGPWSAYNASNAESYIYRKTADSNWENILQGLAPSKGTTASFLVANSNVEGEFFAANNTGIYRTNDCGLSWERIDLPWPKSFETQNAHYLAFENS
jgi:photosystem II stability/assembly factor-like uncharacterized protein